MGSGEAAQKAAHRKSHFSAQQVAADNRTDSQERMENADGEAGRASPCGSWRKNAQTSRLVEAPGIEPGSRGTSVPASTCVARLFPEYTRSGYSAFVGPDSDKQDSGINYRPGFFSGNGRRGGSGGCPRPSSSREPELRPNHTPLRRRVRSGSRVFTPRERTAVQQLSCDRLFTWPTDQPRHATEHFRYPVDTRSPPVTASHH